MRLFLVTLLFTFVVSSSLGLLLFLQNGQVSPSEQLSEVMMLSMRLLNQFQVKFPSMAITFGDMRRGIQNFYGLGVSDEQLTALKIQQIGKMLLTLNPNAASNAQYSQMISLLGFLTNLRSIFPGDLAEFERSMARHGSPGAAIDAAYPPLYNIVYNLGHYRQH